MNYSQSNTLNQTVRDRNYFLTNQVITRLFHSKLQLQFKRCEQLKAKREDWLKRSMITKIKKNCKNQQLTKISIKKDLGYKIKV